MYTYCRRRRTMYALLLAVVGVAEARARISLSARELEVEGSESFVERFNESFEPLIERLTQIAPAAPAAGAAPAAAGTSGTGTPTAIGVGLEFGEVLHGLPKGATDTDRVLLAGYHAQTQSADFTF